jgi:excisionase family DNA binding protein
MAPPDRAATPLRLYCRTPVEPPGRASPKETPDPLLLTPEEAARVLRIGRTRLYALLADASIASVRIGHSRRITVRALQDFVDRLDNSQPTQPPPDPDLPPASPRTISGQGQGNLGLPRRSNRRTTSTAGAVEVLSLPSPVGPLEEQ